MRAACSALLLMGACCATAAGKRVLVLGGVMKSHHIAMVPAAEELAQRGHEVVFALPNTEDGRKFFSKGVRGVRLEYMGRSDLSPGAKSTSGYGQAAGWATLVWNFRGMVEKLLFTMLDDVVDYVEAWRPDVVLSSVAAFALNHRLRELPGGPPVVQLFSASPVPEFVVEDTGVACRYPSVKRPATVQDLKSSLAARVQNQVACRLVQAVMALTRREINAIMSSRGVGPAPGLAQSLREAPVVVAYGGPPMTLPMPLPGNFHLVGLVEKSVPQVVEPSMLAWLDAAAAAGAPVIYISMGTKYELSEETGRRLVRALANLTGSAGVRVLWSLREKQQLALQSVLPGQSEKLRVEAFTPQPEVLAHGAVRAFLSHCGWGGVTDSLTAGVPILAYPGFGDQNMNAMRLVDVGAGLLIDRGMSNLAPSAQRLLTQPAFAAAAKSAGQELLAHGGLDRLVEIIEAASEGTYLPPSPRMVEAMGSIDPFFLREQPLERAICFAAAGTALLFLVLCSFWCGRRCRGGCRRLCRAERELASKDKSA